MGFDICLRFVDVNTTVNMFNLSKCIWKVEGYIWLFKHPMIPIKISGVHEICLGLRKYFKTIHVLGLSWATDPLKRNPPFKMFVILPLMSRDSRPWVVLPQINAICESYDWYGLNKYQSLSLEGSTHTTKWNRAERTTIKNFNNFLFLGVYLFIYIYSPGPAHVRSTDMVIGSWQNRPMYFPLSFSDLVAFVDSFSPSLSM